MTQTLCLPTHPWEVTHIESDVVEKQTYGLPSCVIFFVVTCLLRLPTCSLRVHWHRGRFFADPRFVGVDHFTLVSQKKRNLIQHSQLKETYRIWILEDVILDESRSLKKQSESAQTWWWVVTERVKEFHKGWCWLVIRPLSSIIISFFLIGDKVDSVVYLLFFIFFFYLVLSVIHVFVLIKLLITVIHVFVLIKWLIKAWRLYSQIVIWPPYPVAHPHHSVQPQICLVFSYTYLCRCVQRSIALSRSPSYSFLVKKKYLLVLYFNSVQYSVPQCRGSLHCFLTHLLPPWL